MMRNKMASAGRLNSRGVYSRGVYSAGNFDKDDLLAQDIPFLRHMVCLDNPAAIPDFELRPVVPVKGNSVETFIVTDTAITSNSSGTIIGLSRREGGCIYICKTADSGVSITVGGLPFPARSSSLCFTHPTIVKFSPDPAEDFQFMRSSAFRYAIRDVTVSAALGAAYSGTVSTVALNNLNDLVNTNQATFPTIASTQKDFLINIPAKEGIVAISGPEMITGLQQPRAEGDFVVKSGSSWETTVSFGVVDQELFSGGNFYTIADYWVGGSTTVNDSPQRARGSLPNDLFDADINITLNYNDIVRSSGGGSIEPMQLFACVYYTVSTNSASPFTMPKNDFVQASLFYDTIHQFSTASTILEGTRFLKITRGNMLKSLSMELRAKNYNVLRIVTGIRSTTTNTTNYTLNGTLNIEIQGYYDNITGPALVTSWYNFLPSTQVTFEATRWQEGVPTGSLSQYITLTGVQLLNRTDYMGSLHLVQHLFNNNDIREIRRTYSYSDYSSLKLKANFDAKSVAGSLQAAGTFSSLAHILGPLLGNIPIVGGIAQAILPTIGGIADSLLNTTGYHPGTYYDYSIGESFVVPEPQIKAEDHDSEYHLTSAKYWEIRCFPAVDDSGEVHTMKIIISNIGVMSIHEDGSENKTRYRKLTVKTATDRWMEWYVSDNLLQEENAINQAVEILGTVEPPYKYITVPTDEIISGASFGLAFLSAAMEMPHHPVVLTGVVAVDEKTGLNLQVLPVDCLDLKLKMVLEKGMAIACPIQDEVQFYTSDPEIEIYSPPRLAYMTAKKDTLPLQENASIYCLSTSSDLALLSMLNVEPCYTPVKRSGDNIFQKYSTHLKHKKEVYACDHEPEDETLKELINYLHMGGNVKRMLSVSRQITSKLLKEGIPKHQKLKRPANITKTVLAANDDFELLPIPMARSDATIDNVRNRLGNLNLYHEDEQVPGQQYKLKEGVLFPAICVNSKGHFGKDVMPEMYCIVNYQYPSGILGIVENKNPQVFNNARVHRVVLTPKGWEIDPNEGIPEIKGQSWTWAYSILKSSPRAPDGSICYTGQLTGDMVSGQKRFSKPTVPGLVGLKNIYCTEIGVTLMIPSNEKYFCNFCKHGTLNVDNETHEYTCTNCDNYISFEMTDGVFAASKRKSDDMEASEESVMAGFLALANKDMTWLKRYTALMFLEGTDTLDLFYKYTGKYSTYDNKTDTIKIENNIPWVNFLSSSSGTGSVGGEKSAAKAADILKSFGVNPSEIQITDPGTATTLVAKARKIASDSVGIIDYTPLQAIKMAIRQSKSLALEVSMDEAIPPKIRRIEKRPNRGPVNVDYITDRSELVAMSQTKARKQLHAIGLKDAEITPALIENLSQEIATATIEANPDKFEAKKLVSGDIKGVSVDVVKGVAGKPADKKVTIQKKQIKGIFKGGKFQAVE